ncbi:MAG: hypothetical protein LBK83_15980 [Treponema sp.]|nr:hypothetical protein [Treponema sp.]
MRFTKKVKPAALFAAVLVLFAVLISCGQTVTSPIPEAETGRLAGRVGNFTEEQLNLIGNVPEGALSWLSTTTSTPGQSTVFPAFLDGIWGHQYGDNFHLDDPEDIGYTVYGWPPAAGWRGEFVEVYYFDDLHPEDAGLVFADFTNVYTWCLTPPWSSGYRISATYYERINATTYYLMNLAKELTPDHPWYPDYQYGQPMYATVGDALLELTDPVILNSMLLSWTSYNKQLPQSSN